MVSATCPFCEVPEERVLMSLGGAVAVPDSFPVAEGHSLVVPRSHVASIHDLPRDQQADLWRLVGLVREHLLEKLSPAGFTIGVNGGAAAGHRGQSLWTREPPMKDRVAGMACPHET